MGSLRILVVEDDVSLREMVRFKLQRMGHSVTEAVHGAQALNILRQQEVDVVITDVMMPEKDGLEVIMELRKSFPDVKIIAMSGGFRNEAQDLLSVARLLGARHQLTKPFTMEELEEALGSVGPDR